MLFYHMDNIMFIDLAIREYLVPYMPQTSRFVITKDWAVGSAIGSFKLCYKPPHSEGTHMIQWVDWI